MPKSRIIIAVALLATFAAALPVGAGGSVVTRGAFSEFAAGPALGYEIDGRAVMVRTADGTTKVSILVRGLEPGVTYGSHVHAAACGDGDAGGHYKFDPLGPATPPNEIWPGPFTANRAGIGRGNTSVDQTAGPEAVSVVVHAPDGAKIACADLG